MFSLRQDREHLVDPEHGEAGGDQAGGSEDVPPVEEAEGDALGDAIEPEAHQGHCGEDLDAQGRPGGFRFLPHCWVTDVLMLAAAEREVFSRASLHKKRELTS